MKVKFTGINIYSKGSEHMSGKDVFESNRAAWNQAAAYHQKAFDHALHVGFQDPEFSVFKRKRDYIVNEKLSQIDFSGKTIAHIPCNNGRELLSLMRLGAAEGVGFDISDAAILEAQELAVIAKANARFVRTNALEIDATYNGYFDFIYISQGSLQWFPDLNDYFHVISRLLKQNGQVIIFEIHPFKYFFENGFSFQKQNYDKLTSYFETGPNHYPKGLDYFGNVEYESSEGFWFMHKVSDIITAILHNGIEIESFDEYPLDLDGNPDNDVEGKFPFSYLITGKKK